MGICFLTIEHNKCKWLFGCGDGPYLHNCMIILSVLNLLMSIGSLVVLIRNIVEYCRHKWDEATYKLHNLWLHINMSFSVSLSVLSVIVMMPMCAYYFISIPSYKYYLNIQMRN